jgi:hypothetical protein
LNLQATLRNFNLFFVFSRIKIFHKNLTTIRFFAQNITITINSIIFINLFLIVYKYRTFSINNFWNIIILFELNGWKLNPRRASRPIAHKSIPLLTGLNTSESLKVFTRPSFIQPALFLFHPFFMQSAWANRHIFWKVWHWTWAIFKIFKNFLNFY